MKFSLFPFLLLFSILGNTSCQPQDHIYDVNRIKGEIVIDGKDAESEWSQAKLLEDFTYPWHDIDPPKTTFKAMHDDENLYFYYYAKDTDIRLKRTGDKEMDAVASDRVEVFIKGSDDSDPYYSFEMDPLGRVFDSKGEFGKYIDQEYDFPENGLTFKGVIYDKHYTLEGKISLESLRQLDLIAGDGTICLGLYRGEYYLDEEDKEKTKWISWIIPDSATPNFHIASSFGKIRLR